LFAKQILSTDFIKPITKSLNKYLNANTDIVFKVAEEIYTPSATQKNINTNPNITNINKNYTFDNFIVTDFNKAAYNAAQSIFKKIYWNPIFVSGGVGLGKTHLLYAIGNEYLKLHPEQSVRYITTDEFIREVYGALTSGSEAVENIKNKYRQYDLLLMDDIQFLSKKEKMNEIFFNIFNSNISEGKIIVMTSDKAPNYLDNFEDRMKSRFVSGLTIRIDKPDLQAMVNILEQKIKELEDSFIFTKDAVNYIVHRNSKDVRQLEGYLHRILFYAINNLPPNAIIDVNIIQKYIDKDNENNIKEFGYDVDPNLVIEQISRAYNVNGDLVKSKIRTKQITLVRHICMHALRNKFNMSLEQIGSFFHRDHTTVMEAIGKVEKILKKDDGLRNFITQLYKKI
jgi:chromosomal replication initiator protein